MPHKKVGIMGGTFHPIHNGHLILAENARQQFQLDQIIFLPTGLSPHKKYAKDDSEHRRNMVELAIADNQYFALSELELLSNEVNYTYHTLEQFTEQYPNTEFYFIMGADSLADFHTWRNPKRICQLSSLVVAVRDEVDREQLMKLSTQVQETYDARIMLLDTPNISISSHDIRERVRQGRSIRYLLPEPVRTYLEKQKLYLTMDK